MSEKKHNNHAPMDGNTTDPQTHAGRRKLLKAALLGGGAVTTASRLPEQWSAPVIDSVLLPAHAQTTGEPEALTGVFTATGVASIVMNGRPGVNRGTQYALLDRLISPANANHIIGGICDSDDPSPATIIVRINANGSVDVAVTSDEVGGGGGIFCGATTTYHPGTGAIDDVSVQLDDDEFLDLTGMSANASGVSGSWNTDQNPITDADDSDFCGGNFFAPPGGSFPSTENCSVGV